MNTSSPIFRSIIILLLIAGLACCSCLDIDHFVKFYHKTQRMIIVNNTDEFMYSKSIISFDDKIPFESIDIWVMKKGKPYSNYYIYDKVVDSLCKKESHDENTMFFPCKKNTMDGLNFVYRDSFDKKTKSYFRESYYKDNFTIIRVASLFNKRSHVTDKKINQLVEKYIKKLPLIWKVNDPISSYDKAFSHSVACREQILSGVGSLNCENEHQNLLQVSENMKKAIDQMSLKMDKNLVTSEFINQYKLFFTNTAHDINSIVPSYIEKWSLGQKNKFYHMRSLLISLSSQSQNQDDDNEDTQNKLMIQLYPYAEIVLKKHPNDPTLCTVLASNDSDDHDTPFTKAEKIAFMRKGSQYCSVYYSQISSWFPKNFRPMTPELAGKNVSGLSKKQQVYYGLSYSAYYKRYVIPKIPEALRVMKNKRKNQGYCENKGYFTRERNPYLDAIRQAYLQEGSSYCSPKSTRLTSLDNNLTCFEECKTLGVLDRPIDCVEKCKESPGVLF